MWRQAALNLARCTRSSLHQTRLLHRQRQAIWASNAVLSNGTFFRLFPQGSEVQFRSLLHDESEGASRPRYGSQGDGVYRYRERRWEEEERTASSYGGMLNTFYATRPNLERKLTDLLAQGESAPEAFVRKVLKACSEELHTEAPKARVARAKGMWLQMKEAGVPLGVSSYNSMLSVYLYNKQPFSPTEFLEEMKEAGVMPNEETLLRLLLGYCHQGDIGGAKQILQHAQTSGMSLTEEVYSAFIMGKGRAGDLDGARSVLTMIKENGITPGTESYGALAAAYAEQGDMEGVEKILQEMQDARIFPNHTVYLGLLEALGMFDHHQHIPAVLTRIRNKKWLLTDLRKLMLFFAAAHKFEACVHLLTTLLQYDPFIELMSFNYCLRTVTGHMISTGASQDVVLQLSKKLASASGQASVNSQQDLMLVLYKKGDYDAVLSYARTLVNQGVPVKAQHLYPVLAACSKAGKREELVATLRTIQDLQLPIDRVLFDVIANNGSFTTTSDIMELLKAAEVLDDAQVCTAFVRYIAFREENVAKIPEAIEALLQNTSLTAEEVLQTLTDRVTDGSDLNKGFGAPNLLQPVFAAFGRMKLDWDPAEDALKRVTALLPEQGVLDAVRLTETLLQMGAMPRDAEAAVTAILENLVEGEHTMQLPKFLQALVRHKVAITDHHLSLVAKVTLTPVSSVDEAMTSLKAQLGYEVFTGTSELDRLIRSRRVTDAMMMYDKMCQAGEPISKRSYISLLEMVLSMGGVELAEQIRSEMVQSGHPEYVKVRNCFVRAYARKGDFEKAKLELKEADLEVQSRQGASNYSKEGYYLLLRAYESHSDPQGMLTVLEEMVTDGKTVPGMFFNLTVNAMLKKDSVDEAFSLAVSASDRFKFNGVLGGHIAVVNRLVEDEDYAKVAEVAKVIEQLQDKIALDHILLFAELKAEHNDAARKIGQAEGFTPKPARLRQFHSVLKKLKKSEAVPIVEELMSLHGVSVVGDNPDIRFKEKELVDMGLIGDEENPAGEVVDLKGRTMPDEDKSVGSDSEQEVGVTTSESNPDTVKS